MTSPQTDLLTLTTLENEGDYSRPILDCLNRHTSQEWLAAPFQRDFVWQAHQIKAWGETIERKTSIGVIVTYQLTTGSPMFILDGLQRLTATARYMENPQLYGFSYGPDQAAQYCRRFYMPVQHRHYPSHAVAWEYFERLNRGTILTPYELYRGVLTMAGPAGEMLAFQVPQIVAALEAPYLPMRESSRESEHSHLRDAYSLFLQYATGTDLLRPWRVTGNNLRPRKGYEIPVEKAMAAEIQTRKWGVGEVEKLIRDFRSFLAEQIAEIVLLHREAGGDGKAINFTLWRWLLHLAVWRRNTKRSVELYRELVGRLFAYQFRDLGLHTTTARFLLPEHESRRLQVTLSLGGCQHLLEVCRCFKSVLYEGQRRKSEPMAPGYHASHILPFSKHGDGPTIPEPGPRNRSRGAAPIVQESQP